MFDGQPEVEVGWTVVPRSAGARALPPSSAPRRSRSRPSSASHDIVAFTLPHNVASRRVMEKLGFVYEKTAPYKTFGDHVLYRRRS